MPAPAVDDETRRLEVLQSYHLIDTAPEPAFDDIVNMASLMCGTPIALVSLITEDRQWFKARVGLDQMETPRDQAFCAHAIRNPSSHHGGARCQQGPPLHAQPAGGG
jgi:hypothetical protein